MTNKTLSNRLSIKLGEPLEAHESSEGIVVVGKGFECYVHSFGGSLKSAKFYGAVEKQTKEALAKNRKEREDK